MTNTTTGSILINEEQKVPLVVVGGGLAGTCAAIAAARQGISVALVQERPILGGNSSSEIRVHPVGASQHGYRRDARETGLIEELFLEVRARSYGLRQVNGQHYPMWDVVLAEKAEAELRLTLWLNAQVIGVETEPDLRGGYTSRITALVAIQQGTERVVRLHTDCVIDATGDGFVALQAGAPFRYGREARSEFDERWAPVVTDDVVLGSTIMFSARDVGRAVPYDPPVWAHRFPSESDLPFRNHHEFDSGYWWIEWGGRLNTISENETIRRELHAAVFGVWDHIKNHCTVPGVRERAGNWALDWIGHQPGKRESRRFEGDYILSEADLLAGLNEAPTDAVAYGGWPIDLHAPDGVYSPDHPCTQPPLPQIYAIPLRSLYSRTVSNLFLAGRNISQTHVAHGSTRVMKTCAVIGEASGTAAAYAIRTATSPRGLVANPTVVSEIQQDLLCQGTYLPLVSNHDSRDLAQMSTVAASASSVADLRLSGDGNNEMKWELAGISTAEHAGLIATARRREPHPHEELDVALGQAVVLSTGRLESVTLRLRSTAASSVPIKLRVRPAEHLRDFGPLEGNERQEAVAESHVTLGEERIVFTFDPPMVTAPGTPVVLLLEAQPHLQWLTTTEEPPGTQAGRWDHELGYWRWLHGSLWFEITPVSTPFGAEQVLSGVTRPEAGANMWISDPGLPLPQSLELRWPTAIQASRVDLTFDSQLSGWIWEGSFPLLARDYEIEICDEWDQTWHTIIEVEGNYQRRRVHTFPRRIMSALRVTIVATHGGTTARLVEVRTYASP